MFASKMRIINFQLVEISLSIFHKAVASVVPSPSWMSILFTDSIVSSISLKLLQLAILLLWYVAQIKMITQLWQGQYFCNGGKKNSFSISSSRVGDLF